MDQEDDRGFPSDPLRHIPAALLNSADIQAYQAACGLISPEAFEATEERLKAASYKILCCGDVYWTDELNRRQSQRIAPDQSYTVPRNGIAYISPDVKFRLPDFIAARFNLTIGLVHKGLLLGTGPLIDPGFEGRLLIPIHNLTSQEVELKADDGLIWVEFTKLSPNTRQRYAENEYSFFRSFRPEEKNREIELYFKKTNGIPPQSTLADNAKKWTDAINGAKEAQSASERQEERLKYWVTGAGVATVIAAVSLFAAVWQTYAASIAVVQSAQQNLIETRTQSAELQDNFKKGMQDTLKKEVEALHARIELLEGRFSSLPRNDPRPGASQ